MELLEQKEAMVPVLRFKDIDGASGNEAYKKHLFADLFKFSLGRNIKQDEASPEFETPCVRYGELYHLYDEVINAVVNSTNLERSELLFSDGDEILLPSAGEDPMDIGNASALTLKGVAIGRTINVLKPLRPDTYCHKYVAYYIREKLRETIATLAQGVSISNVYNTQLRTLEIKLPTLPEQRKIAAFLGAVDRKIQHLKRKQELLEQYKKGVVQQLFSQELRFKREDGGEFPEWEERGAGELFRNHSNKKHNSDLPILAATQERGMVPRDTIGIDIKSSQASISTYKVVEPGDFVISLRSFQGGIEYSEVKGICSPAYIVLKPNEPINDQFFKAYFKMDDFITELSNTVVGIRDGKQITYENFSSLTLPLPSLEEQSRIAGFLMALDAKVAGVAQAVAAAQKWKKGLLQQMFA